jgi:hypothetical protein
MSIHTVVWVPSAEDELVDLWLSAHDRNEITGTVHRIDRTLRHRGPDAGIEISEGLFAIEVPPLRALFEIVSADALIRVLKIKRA